MAEKLRALRSQGRYLTAICDYHNKDDFAELFSKFQDNVGKTNRVEKLSAAANILANALLKPGDESKCSFEELDHFMLCVDQLSIGAIVALGAVRAIRRAPNHHGSDNFTTVSRQLASYDQNLVMSLIKELNALNLLHVTEGVVTTADFSHVNVHLTPIGSRFADRFIEGRN